MKRTLALIFCLLLLTGCGKSAAAETTQLETTVPETTQPEKTPASAAPEEVHKEKNGLPTWVKWVWGLVTAAVIGGVVFVLTEPKGKHLRKK